MPGQQRKERILPPKVIEGKTWREFFPNDSLSITKRESMSKYSPLSFTVGSGKQVTVSEGHYFDRKTGHYSGGGPFFTSRISWDFSPGHVTNCERQDSGYVYTGPVVCNPLTAAELKSLSGISSFSSVPFGSENTSSMTEDGATAIHLCNPINPASTLGVGLSEAVKEGLPSIPVIGTWRARTNILKNAGSEFLNQEFGWLPLISEVKEVGKAARQHRDLMQSYHDNEGKNTHRRFDFSSDIQSFALPSSAPSVEPGRGEYAEQTGRRNVTLVKERHRWFEGCFTYGLPSSTDSWRRAMGFGSQADQLFGIALDPEILWELTPWSWAVDWFSNAGDVISNVTAFGLAGLVMRYGYMMEETIDKYHVETDPVKFLCPKAYNSSRVTYSSPCSSTFEVVTKRRVPASPFGFGISWQGLSPTQLAITAALGITRLL